MLVAAAFVDVFMEEASRMHALAEVVAAILETLVPLSEGISNTMSSSKLLFGLVLGCSRVGIDEGQRLSMPMEPGLLFGCHESHLRAGRRSFLSSSVIFMTLVLLLPAALGTDLDCRFVIPQWGAWALS